MGLFDFMFGPPSRDKFAELVLRELRQRGEQRELKYDAERFLICTPDGHTLNLINGYREYCDAPRARRPQLLQRYLQSWTAGQRLELPTDFEDVHPDLLPVVRSRFYLAAASLQAQAHGAPAVDWPQVDLADHLSLGLVYDLPTAMRSISYGDLETWGVTLYEALEAAQRNLEQMNHASFASVDQRLFASTTEDNYDASRLLFRDMIRSFQVRGEPIAMIPNRDTLLVTGSEDEEMLGLMAELAGKAFEQPRPISGIPVRLDGDEWVVWEPPPDCAHRRAFHELRLRSVGSEYNDQKGLLDDLHQAQATDLFVASFSARQRTAEDEPRSFCVWSAGVDTLLPATDDVMFFLPGQEPSEGDVVAAAEWRRVQDVVGHLMTPQGLYPERWRVREFPSAGQLEQLGLLV